MENKHKPALTVTKQTENLVNLGLIVNDKDYAERILNEISYFRLIKGYNHGLKPKNSNYKENIFFEDIVDLYYFDASLRRLLFSQIESIEIILRTRIVNYFCSKYGVLGYLNFENFKNKEYHERFLVEINLEMNRNSKSPYVKNFRENYNGGELPFYALVEIMN